VTSYSLEIHFLGTGGGRFTTITQMRRTAGLRMVHGGTHIHVDPGPGALVFSNWARLTPQNLDAIVVTHCHPDHYTDAEVLVEAMTHGTRRKRGVLAASKSNLQGNDECDPSISRYHQNLVERIETLKAGHTFNVEKLNFQGVDARHSDSDTVGFRMKASDVGSMGYTSDTSYFEGIGEKYKDLRLLVLCTMWPRGEPLRYHLNTDEALRILEEASPGCALLTHFGVKMLRADPDVEATFLEESTGVPTVAARDGMTLILGDCVEVKSPRKKDKTRFIDT
jgi:phosphoribosyl 1,2-cyclic phosphodiesterase